MANSVVPFNERFWDLECFHRFTIAVSSDDLSPALELSKEVRFTWTKNSKCITISEHDSICPIDLPSNLMTYFVCIWTFLSFKFSKKVSPTVW